MSSLANAIATAVSTDMTSCQICTKMRIKSSIIWLVPEKMSKPIHCHEAPAHYTQGEVECIDAMESAFGTERLATYCTINAMKYLWRANEHEDGAERSLRKASYFIHKALQLARESQPSTPRVAEYNDGNVGWEKY